MPYKFKKLGWALLFIASILTFLYFTIDFRFKVPVFAVLSSFAETRYFTVFKTNFADESILLSFVTAFFFLVFTKDKNEQSFFIECRIKAAKITAIVYFCWMFFSILFFYGVVFITVLIFNIILPFIVYLVLYQGYKIKYLKSDTK